ncbi:MAG: GIY-YIG nuclease family protein [candidate division Zixibacteria bacterium]|nr:GIY-YIG nuclease family protein [candidate division Zixibacteria bacterium]MBU1469062.1 GIY-YIG nuclease family protein [candidate division Zixibacteria bacterium]MBU2624638.1 GIY-YIG nuclease family protein [candidate division Zixibacteria bacterium]
MAQYYVYIMANKRNGTLYTGVTGDLIKRVYEHKQKMGSLFTSKYGIDKLVFYEVHEDIQQAILREKRIKEWKRQWKLELIEKMNPEWRDLYPEICGES